MIKSILGGDKVLNDPTKCCCCCDCTGQSGEYRIGSVDGSAFFHSYKE